MSQTLLNPETIEIEGKDGKTRTYQLGDVPYLPDGRQIASQFVTTAMPKVGDYKLNEELSRLMFKYVAVVTDSGDTIILSTDALVNNHVPDFITGIKLEEAMLERCLGFSVAGKLREYQEKWKTTGAGLVTEMLSRLSGVLQKPDSAP